MFSQLNGFSNGLVVRLNDESSTRYAPIGCKYRKVQLFSAYGYCPSASCSWDSFMTLDSTHLERRLGAAPPLG
jgi:hypothetical protein